MSSRWLQGNSGHETAMDDPPAESPPGDHSSSDDETVKGDREDEVIQELIQLYTIAGNQ